MSGRTCITVSNRTDIGEGWRVACRFYPQSLNLPSRPVAEQRGIESETAARQLAEEWAKLYGAEVIP